MEGADKIVYFTHDYTSMCPDKNDYLVGTARLAKKHGVKSLVAVCPVEHNLAYTENKTMSHVEVAQEAQQKALDANKSMSILNTDLVFSNGPTHMLHYIAHRVQSGDIPRGFLQDDVKFNPVHSDDVARAVSHLMSNPAHGLWALQGKDQVSMRELVGLVEKSMSRSEGSTKAATFNNLFARLDEFFAGITVDANLLNMVLDAKDEHPMSGSDFWAATGMQAEGDVHAHHNQLQNTEEFVSGWQNEYKRAAYE